MSSYPYLVAFIRQVLQGRVACHPVGARMNTNLADAFVPAQASSSATYGKLEPLAQSKVDGRRNPPNKTTNEHNDHLQPI